MSRTKHMKKLPAAALLVIVAATMTLAVGLVSAQTAYADSGQLDKIAFNGEEQEWGYVYLIDSKDGTMTLDQMNITVKDTEGNIVPDSQYTLTILRTWWDEEAEMDRTEEVTGPIGLSAGDSDIEAGFNEFIVVASAKNGTEAEAHFMVADRHSLSWIMTNVEVPNHTREGDWRMAYYYAVPLDQLQEPVVTLRDGTRLTAGTEYAITYYLRGDDASDDRNVILSEDNPLPGIPDQAGRYFFKIEGITPYYGSSIMLLDVTNGREAGESSVTAATKKGRPAVVKFAKLRKAKQTVAVKKLINIKDMPVREYKMISEDKKFTVNAKTGKVTVKKGLKKGLYKIQIQVWPAGTYEVSVGMQTVICWIRVK